MFSNEIRNLVRIHARCGHPDSPLPVIVHEAQVIREFIQTLAAHPTIVHHHIIVCGCHGPCVYIMRHQIKIVVFPHNLAVHHNACMGISRVQVKSLIHPLVNHDGHHLRLPASVELPDRCDHLRYFVVDHLGVLRGAHSVPIEYDALRLLLAVVEVVLLECLQEERCEDRGDFLIGLVEGDFGEVFGEAGVQGGAESKHALFGMEGVVTHVDAYQHGACGEAGREGDAPGPCPDLAGDLGEDLRKDTEVPALY